MLLFLCLCLFLLKQWLSAAVSIMQGQDKCCSSAGAETAALRKVPEWVAALQSQSASVRGGHPGWLHGCPRCDRRGIVWTESGAGKGCGGCFSILVGSQRQSRTCGLLEEFHNSTFHRSEERKRECIMANLPT